MRQNRKTRCQICGDVSKGVYYTATSCKSCMDFFRRCVIYKKQYKVNIDSQVCPIKTSIRDYRTPYQCTLSSRLQIVRDRPQSIFESLFTVSRSMKPNSEKMFICSVRVSGNFPKDSDANLDFGDRITF